jgi:DNA-binding response OmpR family regulator
MRVLVIEDEPRLAGYIQKGLAEEAFTADVATDGETGLERARTTTYDLIILDLMLPGVDGMTVCRRLRAEGNDVPILVLSARGMVHDRVSALNAGADDYLTKPFEFAELSARVRAVLRRRQPTAFLPLTVADLSLDPVSRIVRRGHRRLELTQKEYALLEYLLRHAGQVVTRTMIAEHVWNFHWDRLTNVIDVYINHLRKKIEATDEPRLIHAIRGSGYIIRAPESGD